MHKDWNQAVVTDINLAIYVAPNSGRHVHENRPFHGLVLNDAEADKQIHFSDGTLLRTGPGEVHYLPKGSGYWVEQLSGGGCYAINFDLLTDPGEAPFSIRLKKTDEVLRCFRESVQHFAAKPENWAAVIRKNVYDIIARVQQEDSRAYVPGHRHDLLAPAIHYISENYSEREIPVGVLAELCGLSEAYFRRLFNGLYGLSPNRYIRSLKLQRAQALLQSGLFSVSEVCYLSGFRDESYFSREFRKQIGCPPRDFVSQYRK